MTEACLQAIRQKISDNPSFILRVLYPKFKFKPFHKQWFEQGLLDHDELCLGPRNFAKTTVRGVALTIYKMIKNPNTQQGMISDTEGQAIHFVSEIKLQIEKNRLLTSLYPFLKPGRIWRDRELIISGATEIRKGATITAFGYGGATGYEFDEILMDDIVDFENVRTKFQRNKLESWMGMSVTPMLKSGGIIRINGTRYHDDDMYGRLIQKEIYNNQHLGTHRALQPDNTSLWPEMFSTEHLLKIREKIGSIAFNAQYQNDTALMKEGKIFKRKWFKYFKKELANNSEVFVTDDGKRVNRRDLRCFQTGDLALSKKDTADYFVILSFGLDDEGNIFVYNLLRGRFSWNEQKTMVPENYRTNVPLNWLGLEDVQYQGVLADEVNTIADISVRKLKAMGDKVSRAMGMSAKFETGKVYIWRGLPQLDTFEDELTSFPEGEHDDIVDCVGYIPQCIGRERIKIGVNV